MKRPLDLAKRFLAMASRDIKAFYLLAGSAEISDETVGFHAQQAIEKCLKAVLAVNQVPLRKTHNLSELIRLLSENGLPLPPHADKFDELDPYAVILRYDFVDEIDTLDRKQAKQIVESTLEWTQKTLKAHKE